jgi:hypothetical protein
MFRSNNRSAHLTHKLLEIACLPKKSVRVLKWNTFTKARLDALGGRPLEMAIQNLDLAQSREVLIHCVLEEVAPFFQVCR